MVYIVLPIGIVIGFFLALAIIVACGKASQRAEDEARRDRLKNVYERRKLGE